jgi:hypothetical protein
MIRVPAFALAAVLLLASQAGEAQAQNAYCADLVRQYAASSTAGGGLSAEQVARQLTKQQSAASANGCGGFNAGARPSPECPTIMSTIRQLQRQLAVAQASANGGARVAGPSRATIRQQLARNGCGVAQEQTTLASGHGISGAVRTICVRLCDGYYFPISTLGRRDRFKTDAEACQSMYAAGQAELFVQRRRDDVTTAVSLDGKVLYSEQPYAFLYKQGFNPVCQAQLKFGLAALSARYYDALRAMPPPMTKPGGKVAASVYWLPPRLRPSAVGEDPETIAIRAGGLESLFDLRVDETTAMADVAPSVRRVGEVWYADLYDPDKPPAPPAAHRPPLGFDLIGAAMAAEPALVVDTTPTQ